MSTGVSNFLCPRTKNLDRDTWVMAEAEGVYGETMYIREQRGAGAGRKIRGSGYTVQTAVTLLSQDLGSSTQHGPFLFMLYLLHVGLGGKEPPVSVPTVPLIC